MRTIEAANVLHFTSMESIININTSFFTYSHFQLPFDFTRKKKNVIKERFQRFIRSVTLSYSPDDHR